MATKKTAAKKAVAIPKNLAVCADMAGDLKQERLAAQKEVIAPIAEKESAVREFLINNIPKSEATGISGKRWTVKIVSHDGVEVLDKDKLIAYAFKNAKKGGMALISITVNDAAVKDVWANGGKLPGVKPMSYPVLSVTKRS